MKTLLEAIKNVLDEVKPVGPSPLYSRVILHRDTIKELNKQYKRFCHKLDEVS